MAGAARQVDVRPLTAEQEEFLRALVRVVVYLPRRFDADLGRAEGFSMSEYHVLMHLAEAPGLRLRMGELAARTALSAGAVTRVVKLLEAKGLAGRQPSERDGRGHDAVLTEFGKLRLEQVRPAQVETVRRGLFDKLEGADLAECARLLNRIVQDR